MWYDDLVALQNIKNSIVPAESKLYKEPYHQQSNQSNHFASVSKQPEEIQHKYYSCQIMSSLACPTKSRIKETKDRQLLPGHEADF